MLKNTGAGPPPIEDRRPLGRPGGHKIQPFPAGVSKAFLNLRFLVVVAAPAAPRHQNGPSSIILDTVWEPIWLQIGESGALREPYHLLYFRHKTTLLDLSLIHI